MNWLWRRLAETQMALVVLTRLPVGHISQPVPELAAIRWAFPLAGLFVGVITASFYVGLHMMGMPGMLSAILALCAGLLTTGGLHEDGLADCADGFGGGHTAERKLEIMKDSRLGSYGALTLILIMAARVSALSDLSATMQTFCLVVSFAMISRLVMVIYLNRLPSARPDGLGNEASGWRPQDVLSAIIFCLPALIYSGSLAVFSLVALTGIALLFAWLTKRQIGGQTGDVCGAAQMLSETVGWIVLTAYL